LRDVRLRRAVALALDRRALAAVEAGTPGSLFLPPGLPAHQSRAVYPPGPQPARAKALLAGRHPRIVISGEAANPKNRDLVRELRGDLTRVGFRVKAQLTADPWATARGGTPRIDVLLDGWAADYPDPYDFFNLILDPVGSGFGFYPKFFTDRAWLARMRAAARLRGDARLRAYRRLDTAVTTGPVPLAVLYYTNDSPQLFSSRVGCQTFLPQIAGLVDLGSLCLR
jgi:ABC-type transport system substrate-binding protein